jgi:hypothetical protein
MSSLTVASKILPSVMMTACFSFIAATESMHKYARDALEACHSYGAAC